MAVKQPEKEVEPQKSAVEINNLRFTYPGIDGHDPGFLSLYPAIVASLWDPMALWRREVAFAGFEVSIQMDVSAEKMIFGVAGVDPQRRDEFINVLGVDLSWRMHKLSDDQRRRVQICMSLLKPFKFLLLDEIADVLSRADLMRFLKKECQDRGAAIIYAAHIFDGLAAVCMLSK